MRIKFSTNRAMLGEEEWSGGLLGYSYFFSYYARIITPLSETRESGPGRLPAAWTGTGKK